MFFPFGSSVTNRTPLPPFPAANIWLAYVTALEHTMPAMTPFKGVAKSQAEMAGLISRRAQAYMQVPAQLARCRTAQDLLNEQMQFWTAAEAQYGETSRKILEAYGAPAKTAGEPAGKLINLAERAPRQRDYFELPTVKVSRRTAEPVGNPGRASA